MSCTISYKGLNTNRQATLPSVEGWGTNLNILKDPPKGVYTYRRDKVFDNNDIIEQITSDETSNRYMCDTITPYLKGKDPFQAVSYQNAGPGQQASYAYKIIPDGAFRPPLLTLEDLTPLSRLPRVTTNAECNKGFVDFSKSLQCRDNEKEVKTVVVDNDVISNISKSVSFSAARQRTDLKSLIDTPIQTEVKASSSYYDPTIKKVDASHRTIDALHASGQVNKCDKKFIDIFNASDIVVKHKDVLQSSVHSSIKSKHGTLLDNYSYNTDKNIKDMVSVNHKSTISGHQVYTKPEAIMDLKRSLPDASAKSNTSINQHKVLDTEKGHELRDILSVTVKASCGNKDGSSDQFSNYNRDVQLKEQVDRGSFDGNNSKNVPQFNRHFNSPQLSHLINKAPLVLQKCSR